MPVYLVTAPTNPPTEKLVEAANHMGARNHVAKQIITAAVAKQADLFRVAKAGGDIETAGAEAPAVADEQPPASDTPPKDDPPEDTRKRKAAAGE